MFFVHTSEFAEALLYDAREEQRRTDFYRVGVYCYLYVGVHRVSGTMSTYRCDRFRLCFRKLPLIT